ncbi:MAG: hypothetical protein QXU60_00430 [Sulfolobales archaeon]
MKYLTARDLSWIVSYSILIISLSLMLKELLLLGLASAIISLSIILTKLLKTDLISLSYLLISILFLILIRDPIIYLAYYALALSLVVYILLDYMLTPSTMGVLAKIYEVMYIVLIVFVAPLISWFNSFQLGSLTDQNLDKNFVIGFLTALSIYFSISMLLKSDLEALSFFYRLMTRDLLNIVRFLVYLERFLILVVFMIVIYMGSIPLITLLVIGEITRYIIRRMVRIHEKYRQPIDLITPAMMLLYIELIKLPT